MSGRAKKRTTPGTSGTSGISGTPGKQGEVQPRKERVDATERSDARQRLQAAEEEKRQARLQRHAEARAAAERRKRVAIMRRNGIIALIALAVIGGVVALIVQEANKPGQGVAQAPSQHIQSVDVPHSYNNDPPTSGPHLNGIGSWGVSSIPITKELQLHNLEDGGVAINYRPDLDKGTVDKLAELARSYPSDILMAPYPGLANAIVLTAWNRVDRLDALDEARIRRFVNEYRGKDHHKDSGS